VELTTQLDGCKNEYEEPNLHPPICVYGLAAVGKTLTLHCLTSSVLEVGTVTGKISWSYTVT
jgi:hypothetical protein